MADCSNTPTPESTANFDLDSRCFSEAMTSNADYTTARASDGNVKKTFAAALREAGQEHVGEWSTNPEVTSANQVIPYAGTNQLFRPLSLPYQVDSAAHPDPNALLPNPATGYAGELVDVSKFITEGEIIRPFESYSEMLSGSGFIVGQTCSTGGTTWRVISLSSPMTKSDFEALTDILVNDFSTFSEAAEAAQQSKQKLVGDTTGMSLTSKVSINTDMELTGELSVSGDGNIEIIKDDYQTLTVNQSEFTRYERAIPSLVGFTGLVAISTTQLFLKRTGTSEIVYESEVNYCNNGRLTLPLIFDYTASTGFTVLGIAASKNRSTYKLPSFKCSNTTDNIVLVRGDNLHFEAELSENTNATQYKNFIRFSGVSNFTTSPRTKVPFGNPSLESYDFYMYRCIHGNINDPDMAPEAWKSIDGTNYRDIHLVGGVIDAMHSHWGGSDIKVSKTIANKHFSFAGRDLESTYDIDATVLSGDTMVAVRQDYGCMAGQLKLKGKFKPTGSDLSFVKLVTDIQTDPENTRTYLLPNTIDMDVRVYGPNTSSVKIVDTRNNVSYPADQKLNMYKKLDAKIDYSEYQGVPNLRVGVMPYNNSSHEYNITLRDFKDNGKPVQISVGNQSSTALNNVNCNVYANRVMLSTDSIEDRAIIPQSGLISLNECVLVDKMYARDSAGNVSRGQLTINDCRWRFTNANAWLETELSSVFTKISNTIFDGSAIPTVSEGGFWVNVATGNIALNLELSSSFKPYTEATDTYNPSVKAYAPINGVGQKNNFLITDQGRYEPTW